MPHILLIEPDRVLAGTFRQGFESKDYSVVMCAGAQSAIYAADEKQPDLVILELQLIGHSGIEFLYEFRSYPEWQLIPVIVHSQVPPSEFAGSWSLMSNELGVTGYFYKPESTFSQLLRAVDSQLQTATL
jgi:DNA-binding response OmpR family regulator